MLLTVAIPIYNAERYLREAIQSVLDQTFADYELILTDDGSTDGSMEIIRSFQDPRIRVIADGQHKGLAIRLNEQIANAKGAYFVRMDADDVMLPHRLERQVVLLKAHPEADVVGSSAIIIDEEGKRIGWRGAKWEREQYRRTGDLKYREVRSFMHPTVLGKTEWFRKYYYNPACEGCEDQDLWARSADASVFYSLYEPLMLYRDPQKLNLKTYLFRNRQGRYVLRLNRERFSTWWYLKECILSYLKSMTACIFFWLGKDARMLAARNSNVSPLNNHVLHVITSLRTGGAEKLMVDLLPRLREREEEVELVLFDGIRTPFYEALEKKGIRIHVLRTNRSVYDLRNIFALRKYMKCADMVHTHNTAPQLFAAIANMGIGAKLVTTEHNTDNRRRGLRILKWGDEWMYRQYDKIICISKKAEDNLRSYLGNTSEKIITIFNGIDLSRYALPTSEKGIGEKFVISMVAAFRVQKDQKTLIKAMALLPDNYMLQLVGTGVQDLIEACKSLAKELGVADRVVFMGMRNDVPEILKQSEAVVLSSHYEGLSLSSLEGMACGRPFIASDVDGLHEIVDGYGVLFAHEDEKALADAIRKCCEDKGFAQEVARRCQERARMFDIELMAEKYDHEYQKLLEG